MDASRRIRARKRRRQVQRQIFLLSWLLVFLIVILFCCHAQKREDELAAKQVMKAENTKKADKVTVEIETDEQRAKRIKSEAVKQGYPESVIELLDKNVETIDFVEHYGEKKDIPCTSMTSVGAMRLTGQALLLSADAVLLVWRWLRPGLPVMRLSRRRRLRHTEPRIIM